MPGFRLLVVAFLVLIVFNLTTDGNIARVVRGERIGTMVSADPS